MTDRIQVQAALAARRPPFTFIIPRRSELPEDADTLAAILAWAEAPDAPQPEWIAAWAAERPRPVYGAGDLVEAHDDIAHIIRSAQTRLETGTERERREAQIALEQAKRLAAATRPEEVHAVLTCKRPAPRPAVVDAARKLLDGWEYDQEIPAPEPRKPRKAPEPVAPEHAAEEAPVLPLDGAPPEVAPASMTDADGEPAPAGEHEAAVLAAFEDFAARLRGLPLNPGDALRAVVFRGWVDVAGQRPPGFVPGDVEPLPPGSWEHQAVEVDVRFRVRVEASVGPAKPWGPHALLTTRQPDPRCRWEVPGDSDCDPPFEEGVAQDVARAKARAEQAMKDRRG